MSKERWRAVSQAEVPQARKMAGKLRENRKEAMKNAAAAGWLGVTIAGGVAMRFSRDPTTQRIGAGIFLTNVLGPGVLMAKDAAKDAVHKWQGKDSNQQK